MLNMATDRHPDEHRAPRGNDGQEAGMTRGRPLARRAAARACVIAGGGTGGHLFPGIAVAEELRRARPRQPRCVFVSRGSGFERAALPRSRLRAGRHRGRGAQGPRARGTSCGRSRSLPRGVLQSVAVPARVPARPGDRRGQLRRRAGGAGGLAAAASRSRCCEQNALPGVTNRVLARLADADLHLLRTHGRRVRPGQGAVDRQPAAAADPRAAGARPSRGAPGGAVHACWSSAAARAPTASTRRWPRRWHGWRDRQRLRLHPPDRGRGRARRWPRPTAGRGAAARVQAFFDDMAAAYAAGRPGRLPGRGHHRGRDHGARQAGGLRPLPVRGRRPPAPERRGRWSPPARPR
ncbi:MAG: glycosyltransferase [Desulfobacterales bacterium]|nr:glycosyltransferase [Desulfobacterales bacterium]